MDKKEEEILSMHYQIEKTDIKQQKMEDRLMSISKELKRSKKVSNIYFSFIIGLIVLMIAGSFYLMKNETFFSSNESDEIKKLQVINDSLLTEMAKLKAGVLEHKENIVLLADSLDAGKDSVTSQSIKYDRQYCYVTRAFKSNDAIFVEVDFIEYYEGRKAVRKAKEYGDAEYDLDKNGDTLYFLYNNYYIHNQNSTSRILELDDKARVRIENINQISNGFPLKAFQKIIKEKAIFILEMNDGIVYRITEQKLL
ncbi:hypothetical protein U6A24_14345 [Aquimarina gracilis]|uniref:Uncharacterized protein n=1 Tax=Aquimarina gracilis TaxID=874422 RepID=A0ABU5ZXS2_9FLAO|nr:hypothetical protein [Aquimarina gracilis]MEB3346655.1 hypothetical protein [Aquimarina gracilis]